MVLKVAFIAAVPDGDPEKHRASIKTSKYEATFVLVKLGDAKKALTVAKDLVSKEGIQVLELCPGWGHEDVARFQQSVGRNVAVFVCRGDVPSNMMVAQILAKEGWFSAKP